jgi:hypothetical protein
MKAFRLKYPVATVLLCAFSAPFLVAQDNGVNGPPKVLVINREYLKPGRAGTMHEKTESAYIAAAKANKAPFGYLAMTSMSGPDRALFFSGYGSFAAWEAEEKASDKIPALGPALDHAMTADGDLLSATDASIWMRSDEMSYKPTNIMGMRYFELELFLIKPGHDADWEEIVKMVKAAYAKVPGASWSMFAQAFGTSTSGQQYLVAMPMKSLAEIDQHMSSGDKAFADAMGKDGMKKLESLEAVAVQSEQSNLFRISPKMSLPPAEWIAAEPDFWAPKHAAPAKKPAEPAKK